MLAEPFPDGKAASQEWALSARTAPRWPSSRPATGKRSRRPRAWSAETQPRPNVEVNRRAEGTSELNRRLGAVGQGAAALERCGVAGDYGRGCAGKQARCAQVVR